jgi:hypothetical protein
MQLDDTSFSVKPPATVGDVLRDHPGFQLLEDEEAKLLGTRARSATAGDVLRDQLGFQLLEAEEVNLLGARVLRGSDTAGSSSSLVTPRCPHGSLRRAWSGFGSY